MATVLHSIHVRHHRSAEGRDIAASRAHAHLLRDGGRVWLLLAGRSRARRRAAVSMARASHSRWRRCISAAIARSSAASSPIASSTSSTSPQPTNIFLVPTHFHAIFGLEKPSARTLSARHAAHDHLECRAAAASDQGEDRRLLRRRICCTRPTARPRAGSSAIFARAISCARRNASACRSRIPRCALLDADGNEVGPG